MKPKNQEWLKMGVIRSILIGLMVLVAIIGENWPLPLIVAVFVLGMIGLIYMAVWEWKRKKQPVAKATSSQTL